MKIVKINSSLKIIQIIRFIMRTTTINKRRKYTPGCQEPRVKLYLKRLYVYLSILI